MQTINFQNHNGQGITMAADLHTPADFDASRRYPAIVVGHPGGGVKEQAAGLYAAKLAERGFVAIAFDASYQGASGGTPRQLENPSIRSEDFSAVIDHLTTLAFVDAERIGAMGVCAGGGYAANAAITDRRIKALGTVSAVNIGAMFRQGWDGQSPAADAAGLLQFGALARSHDAAKASEAMTIPLAPLRKEDAPNAELAEAWEYYHTPRCQHPNAPGFTYARNLNQLVTYDAFAFADFCLTQPVLSVVGSQAGSRWMSEDLISRAASNDKTLHVVDGGNHMSFYDVPQYVNAAVAQLAPFFQRTLA